MQITTRGRSGQKSAKQTMARKKPSQSFGHDPRVYQTTVKEFIKDKEGNLCKAHTCEAWSLRKTRKPARMMMAEIPGNASIQYMADLVLIAAGFLGSEELCDKSIWRGSQWRTNVATPAGEYHTNVERVFTAGDMHRGQSLVVWAYPREEGEARTRKSMSA